MHALKTSEAVVERLAELAATEDTATDPWYGEWRKIDVADLVNILADRATLLSRIEQVRKRRDMYAARFAESPSLFDHDMVEELDAVLAIMEGRA